MDSEPDNDTELDQIESEVENAAIHRPPVNADRAQSQREKNQTDADQLARLAPFSEVSVIERRFLPTAGRAQLFAGLNYVSNDPWFLVGGITGKGAYYFTDALGIELTASSYSSSAKTSSTDLQTNDQVTTSSFVTLKSYYGLDFLWTPMYGKLGIFNQAIVPFDMYFEAGYGSTGISSGVSGTQTAGTAHLGVGQVYALTKSFGLRWDFSWYHFSANALDATTHLVQNSSFDNLVVLAGVSFFLPEAKYR